MKKIILLTNYQNLIPQRTNETEGLKLDAITKVLKEQNFEVVELKINSFSEYVKSNKNLKGVYVFYTSSQYPIYKNYIQDVIVQITLRGGILIPEFNHFLAHENKSFQEMEKRRLNIKSPSGIPVGTYEEGLVELKKFNYPVVLKKSTGFRSRNVSIAHNQKEAKKILLKMMQQNFNFNRDSVYYLYRKLKNKKEYPKRFGKVVIQEFIPNLTHDWKILVLGNKCMGGKRFVRKNDFRASGSRMYSLEQDPPSEVLNFAMECKNKLNCPNISLDILENENGVQLLEYQSIHFSLLAWETKYYFELKENTWEKIKIQNELDYYIGLGISEYVSQLV